MWSVSSAVHAAAHAGRGWERGAGGVWILADSGGGSPSVKRLCQDTWSSEYCRPSSSSSPHTSEHTPNTQMKPLFSLSERSDLNSDDWVRWSNVDVFLHRLIPILVNGMKYSEIDIILLKVSHHIWDMIQGYSFESNHVYCISWICIHIIFNNDSQAFDSDPFWVF